jgi:hypothetical protein
VPAALAVALIAGIGIPVFALSNTPTYRIDHTVVDDSMNRSISTGWGSAPIGGSYTYAAPKSFAVNGTKGAIALAASGASRTATLAAATSGDTSASFSATFSAIPTRGNGVSTGVQVRRVGNSYYQAAVRVAPGGKAYLSVQRVTGTTANQKLLGNVSLPFTVSPSTPVSIELQVVGTTSVSLSARAWLTSATTPGWQIATSDETAARLTAAGGIGVWSYLSSGSAPTAVKVDNLTAYALVLDSVAPAASPSVTAVSPSATASTTAKPTATPTPTPTPSKTATASPTPTPSATTEPTAPVSTNDPASTSSPTGARVTTAGAATVGSTSYAIPGGAVYVSAAGSANGKGTLASPYRTLAAAIAASPSGSTIVMRAGTYHETVTIPVNKKLTIQSYPKEAVWLDGSSVVGNWKQSGSTWVATGWNAQFDSSATYTRGVPDGAQYGWNFLNASYPLAAHPDQLWIGGVAQTQVGSAAAVTPGTFYVDYAAKTLTIGTNPSTGTVRASDLVKAMSIRGADSTVKGIGIRRYAPSVPDMGAVTMEKSGITLENVAITDTSTTGLYVIGTGNTLRNVTASRNGLLGIGASNADNLTVSGVLAQGNNTERFNNAPVSGGMKLTRMRNVTVTNSVFAQNLGPGLWFDESVYNGTITGNDILDNLGHGLITEISAKMLIANNIVSGNRDNGMKINDTSQVSIWNNTLTGNGRSINIVQDARRASNLSTPGHDPRQSQPDPTVSWVTGPVDVENNIIANTTAGNNCLLCVEDYSHAYSASQLGVTAQGNVYQRADAATPAWDVIWSTGAGNPQVFTTAAAFAAATGQDTRATGVVGSAVLGAGWVPTATVTAAVPNAAPLSAAIAAATGKAAGSLGLGAWIG